MKKILLLLLLISSFTYSQIESLCEQCVEQNGFYCGDDPTNWTQYSPNGCVPNGPNLFYLNDGWEDCVDASDEENAVSTIIEDCGIMPELCDTVYVDVPLYIYETIFQTDTIYDIEYITQIVLDTVEVEVFVPEYIFVTDTLWMEGALDTMFIDIIEYVDVFIFDTIVEIEYVEFFITDTIIEYIDVISIEYIDCATGLPCNSNIPELLNKYKQNSVIYNINGQAIKNREGLYIEDGKVKFMLK
tara:strand:- start:150 stop:881 length:732 start_codon:yes stop_codon:yes gene_type:complete